METDWQTYRQKGIMTDRQMDRQTYKQTDKQTDGQMDRRKDRQKDSQTDSTSLVLEYNFIHSNNNNLMTIYFEEMSINFLDYNFSIHLLSLA